jgi:hypothetical protein
MPNQIDELIRRLKEIEAELAAGVESKRADIQAVIYEKKLHLAEDVSRLKLRIRTGLLSYIIGINPLIILSAPVIYSGFVPLLMLDLFLLIYQSICFPIYGIPRVLRSDYLVFDREDLPYLNVIEKFNCFYCAYANGLAAYMREIASRTEQYWCPIKHARRILAAHGRYPRFLDYGDAESYRMGLERLRKEYEENKKDKVK